MEHVLKTYEEAKKYFSRACKTRKPAEVILFHDQRRTVAKLLKEVCEECGRILIDKDLADMGQNELGIMRIENVMPKWLKPVFENEGKKKYLLYLREFHMATRNVQDDVMNILVKKEVQDMDFPDNLLIVLGVRKEDENTEPLTHTHVLKFYK